MKLRIVGLLALGLLAGPIPAMASPVTWTFSGVVGNAQGTNPVGVGVGTPYNISFTYDTSAGLLDSGCGPGQVTGCWKEFDPSLVRFTIDFGQDCEPDAGYQPCSTGEVNTLFNGGGIRYSYTDVYNDVFLGGVGGVRDSLQFRLYLGEYDDTHLLRLTFNTFFTDLSAFSSPDLPGSQPNPDTEFNWGICTALASGPNAGFCDTNFESYWRIDAEGTRTVPEPGTLALFGCGLAGLGMTRRRKKF